MEDVRDCGQFVDGVVVPCSEVKLAVGCVVCGAAVVNGRGLGGACRLLDVWREDFELVL